TIEANLTDGFLIDISAATASAGAVAFEVTNRGQLLHEMLIIRTDLAEDALPIDGVTVDESQLDVVAGTIELPPDQSQLLLTDLQAGAYVLVCNIPGHYNAGMHRAFTVQ
ncbi:MAG: sulfocyanin-like copper-binding protein, partial [Dehalococcoidia bacterium]